MDFWNTEGQNVKQSKINELIKNDAPLEQFYKETSFMDEFYTQKPELIKILSQKKNLEKLINWIYTIKPKKNFSKKENCEFAFYSFTILSTCNPDITKEIIKDINLIEKLFYITQCDSNLYITAQGYFQSILKNLLSKMNPFLNQFINVFMSCGKKWVFCIVNNLNQANREIVKDILSNKCDKMKNLQQFMFDYLITYFLNELFIDNKNDINDIFENVNSIFSFLKKNKINFFFKKKYSQNLFSNKSVKAKQFSEYLYSFKMNLLTYLVSIDQFKTYKNPYLFLYSCKKFKTSNKYMFYLMQNLSLFCNFSEKEEFLNDCSFEFIKLLLEIAQEEKKKDIIHKKLFYILENLKNFINNDKKSFDFVISFLINKKNNFLNPNMTKKNINNISYKFILDILKNINFEQITNNQLKQDLINFKNELEKNYTTLCSNDKIKSVNNIMEQKIFISDDFNFFGSKENLVDDKRFHYEDDIFNKKSLNNKNENKNKINVDKIENISDNKIEINKKNIDPFETFNYNDIKKNKKNDLFENFDNKNNNPNKKTDFSAFDDFK